MVVQLQRQPNWKEHRALEEILWFLIKFNVICVKVFAISYPASSDEESGFG